MDVNIQERQYRLVLSLGSKYPLKLNPSSASPLNKKEKGMGFYTDLDGNKSEVPLYQIPSLNLGELLIKNTTTAIPFSNEKIECIDWPFDQYNLLFDLPHRRAYPIKKEYQLHQLGIDLKKMKRVDYTLGPGGIRFCPTLSVGQVPIALASDVQLNILDKSFYEQQNTSSLSAEVMGLGWENFYSWPITSEMGAKGILGAPFLKEHIVYVDAKKKHLYIGLNGCNTLSGPPLEKIPLEFNMGGIPVVHVKAKGKQYASIVDIGSAWEFSLRDLAFFENLTLLSEAISIDGLGKRSPALCYLLPSLSIGKMELKNLSLYKEFQPAGVKLDIKAEIRGSFKGTALGNIGLPLLYRTDLYFDCPNSALWMVKDRSYLTKMGIHLEEFTQLSFDLHEGLIRVKVTTDQGDLKLLFDTGASGTVIKPEIFGKSHLARDQLGNPCFATNAFVVGGVDYGRHILYPFSLSPQLGEYDGILGMDFLREHPFYIDFYNKTVYVKKPSSKCL